MRSCRGETTRYCSINQPDLEYKADSEKKVRITKQTRGSWESSRISLNGYNQCNFRCFRINSFENLASPSDIISQFNTTPVHSYFLAEFLRVSGPFFSRYYITMKSSTCFILSIVFVWFAILLPFSRALADFPIIADKTPTSAVQELRNATADMDYPLWWDTMNNTTPSPFGDGHFRRIIGQIAREEQIQKVMDQGMKEVERLYTESNNTFCLSAKKGELLYQKIRSEVLQEQFLVNLMIRQAIEERAAAERDIKVEQLLKERCTQPRSTDGPYQLLGQSPAPRPAPSQWMYPFRPAQNGWPMQNPVNQVSDTWANPAVGAAQGSLCGNLFQISLLALVVLRCST